MALEIEVIYENGVLKLPRQLPLEAGLKVKITIHPPKVESEKAVGSSPGPAAMRNWNAWRLTRSAARRRVDDFCGPPRR